MNPNAPQISAEITPNPNTLKFVVNRSFMEAGSMDFPDREKAQGSPLAKRLFEVPQVSGVFIGTNFVTVTKVSEADWNQLVTPVVSALREVLSSGDAVVNEQAAGEAAHATTDPVAIRIQEILNREIRPAVAMDGGDITFVSYEDGVVSLRLRGSCSACPSSVMTLRMGVENRLRSEIPEIKEVVQV